MPITVRLHSYDVDQRLRSMGLTRDLLMAGVEAVATAHNGCTENDPPSAACWDGWRMGTRRLREVLRPMGWEKDDTGTFSLVVDHSREQQIVVVNTDQWTGLRGRAPVNKARKGPFSTRTADANQFVLDIADFRQERERFIRQREDGGYTTWCLCVFVDGEVVRAELSQPVMYAGGFVRRWEERIILTGEDPATGRLIIANDDGDDGMSPEFPIIVQRK